MPTKKLKTPEEARALVAQQVSGFDASELIAYLDIVQSVVIELLSERGMSAADLRARRKELVNSELAAIDAEIAKFSPPAP